MSKGSGRRPAQEKGSYEAGYERIFGKAPKAKARERTDAWEAEAPSWGQVAGVSIGTGRSEELGHTFLEHRICMECGVSREAALHFGWECRYGQPYLAGEVAGVKVIANPAMPRDRVEMHGGDCRCPICRLWREGAP